MLPGGSWGAPGGSESGIRKAKGIPTTPKKTKNPPQIKMEIRAQFLRKKSPMPVAMPNMETPIMNASITNISDLAAGGSPGAVFSDVFSMNAKNVIAPTRRKNKVARSATTAAPITDAEGLEGLDIATLV
jgi:hypothetical protein